jgi:hypothetical protein
MIRRRLNITSGTNASNICTPTHLIAFPDKYPIPGTPDDPVDVVRAESDDEMELRSLIRTDRKSVRLGLCCQRKGRWNWIVLDNLTETSSDSL